MEHVIAINVTLFLFFNDPLQEAGLLVVLLPVNGVGDVDGGEVASPVELVPLVGAVA